MSGARVTEAHEREAAKLAKKVVWDISGGRDGIALALAQAEAAQRRACADIVLVHRLSDALPSHSRELGLLRQELAAAILSGGAS